MLPSNKSGGYHHLFRDVWDIMTQPRLNLCWAVWTQRPTSHSILWNHLLSSQCSLLAIFYGPNHTILISSKTWLVFLQPGEHQSFSPFLFGLFGTPCVWSCLHFIIYSPPFHSSVNSSRLVISTTLSQPLLPRTPNLSGHFRGTVFSSLSFLSHQATVLLLSITFSIWTLDIWVPQGSWF